MGRVINITHWAEESYYNEDENRVRTNRIEKYKNAETKEEKDYWKTQIYQGNKSQSQKLTRKDFERRNLKGKEISKIINEQLSEEYNNLCDHCKKNNIPPDTLSSTMYFINEGNYELYMSKIEKDFGTDIKDKIEEFCIALKLILGKQYQEPEDYLDQLKQAHQEDSKTIKSQKKPWIIVDGVKKKSVDD